MTNPGDTVFIMNGTYSSSNKVAILVINRSGSASSGVITYKAYPGHSPLIKVYDTQNLDYQAAVAIFGASYIVIDGLRIEGNRDGIPVGNSGNAAGADTAWGLYHYLVANKNNPGSWDSSYVRRYRNYGIQVIPAQGNTPHHITLQNNTVSKFPGNGIGIAKSDYIDVIGNTVFGNAFYSADGNSGISIYEPVDIDANTGPKIRVLKNVVYNNENMTPWYRVQAYTDGNGIIIDDTKHTQASGEMPYEGRIQLFNNIAYENGGAGINVFSSEHAEVSNNTLYRNQKTSVINKGDLAINQSNDITARNNIVHGRDGKHINNDDQTTNLTSSHNIFYKGVVVFQGNQDLNVAPLFQSPSTYDFRLQASSPAVDSGTSWNAPIFDIEGSSRPQGGSYDRGVYEFIE